MLTPIAARAGHLLVVWPGHPTHTLTVTDASGRQIVRYTAVEPGALWGPLLILDADGVLEYRTPSDRQVAQRSLAS